MNIETREWLEIASSIQKPWPKAAMRIDLNAHREMAADFGVPLPTVAQFAGRWGCSQSTVKRIKAAS